jgi:hypothetical protein
MKKADEMKLATSCGEHCEPCPYYKGEKPPPCAGCNVHKGHPFWGECKLYACVTKHDIEHCGSCIDFPCDFFIGHFDPNNPEGQRNAVTRAGLLAYRKKHGDKKWLTLYKKLS